jgi:signal transduction histidine kinase
VFLRSASARLSALYAGLLLLSFVIAALATSAATASASFRDARARIGIEANALLQEAATEGTDAAVAAVAARARQPGALEYRVIDRTGQTVAGSAVLPIGPTGWRSVDIAAGDFLMFTTALPGGGSLIVADDLERAERVHDQIIRTLFLVAAMTAALGLVAGVLITRRVLARMDALTNAARLVAEGDLTARAPTPRVDRDDIDAFTRAFNAMLDRIGMLVANVRRVSTDVAHDLRTPLSHVGQSLERAAQAVSTSEAKIELERAQRHLDQVTRTFAAMLRLAEIEAGELRRHFVEVDLSAVTERVVDAYRPDIDAGGRTLTAEVEPKISVRGDPDLLAQALANLIENSARHTPTSSHIRVSLRREGEDIRLAVWDNGPGIPADFRDKVLEPFFRLDPVRTKGGAGLGLSIVAAIVHLHEAILAIDDAQPGLEVGIVFKRNGT